MSEIVGYIEDPKDGWSEIVCAECAECYDVSDLIPISRGSADVFDDICTTCRKHLRDMER